MTESERAHLSEIAYLLMCNFNKNFYDEIDGLGGVFVHFHQADAVGEEVHQEVEEDGHVVDLGGLGDAAQGLECGRDLLLDALLLAHLLEVLLVYHPQEALLQRLQNLQNTAQILKG